MIDRVSLHRYQGAMHRRIIACCGVWASVVGTATAGMTVVTLTDMARLRLESLSFFIAAYLLISLCVKWLWNHLAKVIPNMPHFGYSRALALVFLSGLLFYVLLTMISGARELLTPGAWEKQGVGYRLRGEVGELPDKEARRERMRTLRDAIWAHAETHEGAAPGSPFAPGMNPDLWRFPAGGFYAIVPGVKPGVGRGILVFEPSAAGPRRVILLADGSVEDLPEGTLHHRLESQLRNHQP